MCQSSECYLIETGYSFELDNGERGFKRNEYIPCNTIYDFCVKRNWYSAFRSAYRYDGFNADKAKLYGDFYLDLDCEDDFEKVRSDSIKALKYLSIVMKIQPENVFIYFSGCKGIHLFIPAEIFEIQAISRLNSIYKYIAKCISTYSEYKTIDLKIYDNKRLLRIPNTRHEKTGLYKIQLTYDELQNASEAIIKQKAMTQGELWVPQPIDSNKEAKRIFERMTDEYLEEEEEIIRKSKAKSKTKLTFTPPCIRSLLENGANKGCRNISIACLTVFYKNTGLSLEETLTIIEEWNNGNECPTGTMELKKTVRSMYMTEKTFGCTTLKDISFCEPKLCKLYRERKK